MSIFESQQAGLVLSKNLVIVVGTSTASARLLNGPLDQAYQLTSVQANCGVVGTTSATLNIAKATGSTPIGSATPMLSAAINCVGSADITLTGAQIGSQAIQALAAGDRLVAQHAGTWPIGTDVGVTLVLKRI
mgnify:CR=1 FL=1